MATADLIVQLKVHEPWWMMPLLKAYYLLLWVGLQTGITTAEKMNERLGQAVRDLVMRNVRVSNPKTL